MLQHERSGGMRRKSAVASAAKRIAVPVAESQLNDEARRFGALGLVGRVVHPAAIDGVDFDRMLAVDHAVEARDFESPATAPRVAAARRASRDRSPRPPVRH